MKPLSVTNGWQQLCPCDNLPAFLVAKSVSMKKCSFMGLHSSILSFVPWFLDSGVVLGPLVVLA
jgi:hypothetical protein